MKWDEWNEARKAQDEELARRHRERELAHESKPVEKMRQAWCIWCGRPMLLPASSIQDRLCEVCVNERTGHSQAGR
jgi:hypothetical protein